MSMPSLVRIGFHRVCAIATKKMGGSLSTSKRQLPSFIVSSYDMDACLIKLFLGVFQQIGLRPGYGVGIGA